jgi:molybdopterin-guanine dinucleotide biosynthesis protein A
MGTDKALLPFLGTPLIERLRDRFQSLESEMMIICNEFPSYEYLGLPLHTDLIPDRGALGGLYTALEISETPFLGLIAADMPFASPLLVKYMLDQLQDKNADAILPSTDFGVEPLHAVYRRKTCLPLVKEAIAQNLWRMNAWHDQANIEIIEPKQTINISESQYTFVNLNTPEDVSQAEKLAIQFNLL